MGMGFLRDHQQSAITDTIYRIVSSEDYSLDIELGPLLSMIRDERDRDNDYKYTLNQEETARCIRKKLKYGNSLQQLRTLELLDLFISQGLKFNVMYNDTKMINQLRIIATNSDSNGNGENYSSKMVKRTNHAIRDWYQLIQDNNNQNKRCYESLIELYHGIKNTKVKPTVATRDATNTRIHRSRRHTRNNNFMDDSADESIFGSAATYNDTRDTADIKYRIPKINITKEAPKIKLIISDAMAAAVSLHNALVILGNGRNAMDDKDATQCFIKARAIRRKVLRYLQLVTEGEFLGSLLHANDELVKTLTEYDEKSNKNDDETSSNYSDSDDSSYFANDSLRNDHSSAEEASSDSEEEINGWTIDSSRQDRRNSFTQPTSSNPFGDDNQI